jgi:3-oxoacyl-[acyl-carrier-protein] synthase II
MAPLDSIGEAHITLTERGARRISPHFIPRILPNMAGGHISIRYGLRGPLLTPSSACATGSHAIGDAYRLIKHGYAKEMIAGGTEAAVNTLAIAGFSQAKALCTIFNESPNISSRPFDRQRDGFVIGEGAGIVVLEEREAAIKRGAKIYGEIGGYGCSADAFHITASHPNGKGAEDAMRAALQEANILPEQVNHVNAHATSTPIGDLAEACAINRLLPTRPIVTANKGSIGHLLGAAGAVESIFTLLSLSHGIIPPTINFEEADCKEISQLNIMSETEQRSSGKNGSNLRVALCNSFGFGGTNASLCFIKHGQ